MQRLSRLPPKVARQKKGIRKVMAAIRFAEQEKARKAPILKRRWEERSYMKQNEAFINKNLRRNIKTARKNYKDDWNMGQLRPNRAYGDSAELHGVMRREDMSRPEIPEHMLEGKTWPIVKDDRVVIIRGRNKGRIGEVSEVMKHRNLVLLKDVNKVWADSAMFNTPEGVDFEAKRETEYPISYDDIRLVTSYQHGPERKVEYWENGELKVKMEKRKQDVIVDAIEMRKHTRGLDAWTGEWKYSISEAHQKDPENHEEVIYTRVIAGTEDTIPWPWEIEEKKKAEERGKAELKEEDLGLGARARTALSRMFGRTPPAANTSSFYSIEQQSGIMSRFFGKKKTQEEEYTMVDPDKEAEMEEPKAPRAAPMQDYNVYPDDTSRRVVENDGEFDKYRWVPQLLFQPMPQGVVDELRDKYTGKAYIEEINEERKKTLEERLKKDDAFKARQAAEKEEKERQKLEKVKKFEAMMDSVKTPKQVARDLRLKEKEEVRASQPQVLDPRTAKLIQMAMRSKSAKLENLEERLQKTDARKPRKEVLDDVD